MILLVGLVGSLDGLKCFKLGPTWCAWLGFWVRWASVSVGYPKGSVGRRTRLLLSRARQVVFDVKLCGWRNSLSLSISYPTRKRVFVFLPPSCPCLVDRWPPAAGALNTAMHLVVRHHREGAWKAIGPLWISASTNTVGSSNDTNVHQATPSRAPHSATRHVLPSHSTSAAMGPTIEGDDELRDVPRRGERERTRDCSIVTYARNTDGGVASTSPAEAGQRAT